MTRAIIAGCVLWLAGASMVSATTYVSMADGDLADQAAVVARVKVVGVEPGPASGTPATDYLVEVEDVAKGDLPGSTIGVRVPGGVRADGLGLKIWGAPEFQVGDEPLLFLERGPDGVFRILHLMLGAFHAQRSGVAVLALQDLSQAQRLGGAEEPGVRDLDRFAAWVADRALGLRRAPDYWRPAPAGLEEGREKYVQIKGPDGLPVRWFDFDGGKSVAWKLDSAGQPGLDPSQAQERFKAALEAWNADPTSTIQYTYSGLIAAGSGKGLGGTDHVNAVLFNDPRNANVPGTFDCHAGGVLAMGGPYFDANTTRSYRGQPYHVALEADIVVQDGTECFFRDNPVGLEEVLAHELGHTLGFAHSADKNSLMWPTAHDDGRGAKLADDDRMGASVMYGDGSFQPAPPPPPASSNGPLKLKATVVKTQVKLGWANAPGGTAELRIECQESKKPFQPVQMVSGEMTAATLGLSANKTYALRLVAMDADGAVLGTSNTVKVRTRK
jgi:Matrixin